MSMIYWTGGASPDAPKSGEYRNPNYWSSKQVPGANDDVVLGGQGYQVTLARGGKQFEQVNSFEIAAGTKLRVLDSLGGTDPAGQTTLAAQTFDSKGAIVLGGGQITANFGTLESTGTINGWGTVNAHLTAYGNINATKDGDGILHLVGAEVHGKLSGSGEIDLDADSTIYANSVSVATLRSFSTHLATDLNLSKTFFEAFDTDDLQGHTLTLNDSLLINHQFNYAGQNNGLVHNIGNMSMGGASFFCKVQNDGAMQIEGGSASNLYLSIFGGQVTGHGSMDIDPYARVVFGDAVSINQFVQLHGNSTIDYAGQHPGTLRAIFSGFGSSDHFDFSEVGSDQASLTYTGDSTGGTLVLHADGQVASLHLVGDYVASNFVATSDGEHGTMISYHDMTANGSLLHI